MFCVLLHIFVNYNCGYNCNSRASCQQLNNSLRWNTNLVMHKELHVILLCSCIILLLIFQIVIYIHHNILYIHSYFPYTLYTLTFLPLPSFLNLTLNSAQQGRIFQNLRSIFYEMIWDKSY